MTDKKISELSSNGTLGTLDGTELIPLVQSGGNVKALLSAVKTFIIEGFRYQFLNDSTTTLTTYTVPASAVTANGNTIIELSNNSLTSITVNTSTAIGKVAGDSVNISITGTYTAQALVASGVTLQGDLTFSYQYETKTLVYKGSNVWKVVG